MKPCGFSGCDRPLYRAGLCHGHRSQKRYGLAFTPLRNRDRAERFWSRISKTGGCWIFQGVKDESGYGTVRWDGRMQKAHRVVWQLANGPIPEDKQVLHRCDNPPCVRPDHLFLGDNAANVDDKVAKDRQVRHERSTSAKLTEAQVAEMRHLWGLNESSLSLSVAFGVCEAHVRRICRGKYWKGPITHSQQARVQLAATERLLSLH